MKKMKLDKEQIKIILEVFEDYHDILSKLSQGSLMSEEWEIYNLLKSEYEI